MKSVKKKSALKKIMNFIFAFILGGIFLLTVGAVIIADTQSKNTSGEFGESIFSYTKTEDDILHIMAFGESFELNYGSIFKLKDKAAEFSDFNKKYSPSIVTYTGEAIKNCVADVGTNLMKLPEIINFYYEKYTGNKE